MLQKIWRFNVNWTPLGGMSVIDNEFYNQKYSHDNPIFSWDKKKFVCDYTIGFIVAIIISLNFSPYNTFDFYNLMNCIGYILLYFIVPLRSNSDDNWTTYAFPLKNYDSKEFHK